MEEKLSESREILGRLKEKRVGKNVASASPDVSVIIPAYNIAGFVRETLDSVFAQTFKDFEVVIVDDGSDDAAELRLQLEPYIDDIVFASQSNAGAAKTRNLAIVLARGRLIAFLDGDDIWHPDYLESQVNYLESNQLDMVYCDAELFGERLFGDETYMKSAPSVGRVTPVSLINASCNVITSGTVVKQNALKKYGLFDQDFRRAQDFDLWFRLAKNGIRIGYQLDALLKYRVSSSSLSGSNVQRSQRNVRVLKRIGQKYSLTNRELGVWRSQIVLSEAELELERGKFELTRENFPEAIEHFRKANKYYRKWRLTIMKLLLKVFPKLAVKLFKVWRPGEFSFISGDQESKYHLS